MKSMVAPRGTEDCVAKPWMVGSPAPLMSHSCAHQRSVGNGGDEGQLVLRPVGNGGDWRGL